MTDFIDISFVGDDDLQRQLKRIAIQAQRKIVRAAMRKSMKSVKERAQALVPVDSGRLRDSIHQKSRTKRGITRVFVSTGTRQELGIPSDAKGFYPAVIEYGTRTRAAYSYLRRALHEKRGTVLKAVASDIGKGIEREAKK